MPDLIPNQNLSAMFGASVGNSIGSGLGAGLQALAQQKLGEINLQKNAQLFQKSFNVDEPTSQTLALLQQQHPESFNHILGMLGGGSNPGQFPSQEGQPSQNMFNRIIPGGSKAESKEDVKRDIAEQQRLEPFIKGQSEDYNMAKKLRSKAENMLTILKKHKKDWPGFIGGKLPESFHRNPAVRKYIADANTLVTLLANSRKGQPTNAKIRFEQLSKPNLDQPYETQVQLLEDIIKDSDIVFDNQKNLEKIRKENGGKYPADIRQRIIEGGLEAINENSEAQNKQLGKITDQERVTFAGNEVQDDTGQYYVWDPARKMYIEADAE